MASSTPTVAPVAPAPATSAFPIDLSSLAKLGFKVSQADSCETDIFTKVQAAISDVVLKAQQNQTGDALSKIVNNVVQVILLLQESGQQNCPNYGVTLEPIFEDIGKIFYEADADIVKIFDKLLQGK